MEETIRLPWREARFEKKNHPAQVQAIFREAYRFTLRKPLPLVNFKEWDGLIWICFGRKNKTLGSIFRQKSVISLLDKNYKTLQAMHLSQIGLMEDDDTAMEMDVSGLRDAMLNMEEDDADDKDEDMEMEDDGDADAAAAEFKEKILKVLKQGDFEERRSSKLTKQEFLYFLSMFNGPGIHSS